MALYTYIKAQPAPLLPPASTPPRPSWLARVAAPAMVTMGSLLVANVIWPLLSYQIFTAPGIKRTEFSAPIPDDQVGNFPPNPATTKPLSGAPQVLGVDLDYTNPSNWFPEAPYYVSRDNITYTIDIPSLDIEEAQVEYAGEELDDHLLQYPGTAMPGQLGSPVIFGHSILRQFYNPSINNPNRFTSIFSKIMTLKNGDKIYVNYDNIRYTYEVKDKVEVQPEDLFILEQRYNNRELKLITCVPEGTYLRRGVIVAQLVDVN
jgi:sortase A